MGHFNDMCDWAAENGFDLEDANGTEVAEAYNQSMIQGRTVRPLRVFRNPSPVYRRPRAIVRIDDRSRSPRWQPTSRRTSPAPSRCSESSSGRSDASVSSFMSAADVGGKCYLEGTMFKDLNGRFVHVEDLQQFDSIRAGNNQATNILRITPQPGPHEVVSISAGGVVLSVTSNHRIVVIRGGRQEPAPARALRMGDEVVIGQLNKMIDHPPQLANVHKLAFDIVFEPDTSIETWNALPPDAILTRGSRPPRSRRRQAFLSSRNIDNDSIPCTNDSFE